MEIAKGTQRLGQTKEHTKLIAQGIQKGIEQYKKQHKAKLRELDKKRKKTVTTSVEQLPAEKVVSTEPEVKRHYLPWLLLVLSWLFFGAYLTMS